MRLCIVGIGGMGGKVAQEFLRNEDLVSCKLAEFTGGEHVTSGGIKGVWLESDENDAKNKNMFFKDGRQNTHDYPLYFIPHDVVPDGHPVHMKYGYDIKKQGYVRDAQYLKAVFEVFEDDPEIRVKVQDLRSANPIFDCAWSAVRPYTTLGKGKCDGILFIISFGGGTGTGFVNPIVQHIRSTGKGDYPVFVLGVLTEEGTKSDREQYAKEGKRNLGAISSIYDLLTKGDGVDGVILVDNQILLSRCEGDYTLANRYLHQVKLPMIAGRDFPGEKPPSPAVRAFCTEGWSFPSILVPCYSRIRRRSKPETSLVEEALSTGRLFGCQPRDADKVIVFSRGYLDTSKIRKAITEQIPDLTDDQIAVWRKLGDNSHVEMLILLRNPYGSPGSYLKEGTLEWRLHRVMASSIAYIDGHKADLLYLKGYSELDQTGELTVSNETTKALDNFFYGVRGLKAELELAMKRIERGERPFFKRPLRIFDIVNPDQKSAYSLDPNYDEITPAQRAQLRRMIQEELELMGIKT
ncbi:FtsZ/tubulin family protein [Candidatus Methanocrinis natronophilus]|uniref:Tubulin/FtsZ GTPase domain-containing protein n=1 Tax=Candidatus Methanocrinis natronophilus TaxID=3033396 RepID=A0ABT5X4Q7_9EURY|nr:hypothetical protein [Candidatus Methanocrinis natronophilus]MDF0589684.1 hypothetical protein [Candidatus Methanocrinis natronophilus]